MESAARRTAQLSTSRFRFEAEAEALRQHVQMELLRGAPRPVRIGTIVRTTGSEPGPKVPCFFYAFADVRYDDGRTERWIGVGCDADLDDMTRVIGEAREFAHDHEEDMCGEVQRAYSDVDASHWCDLPVEVYFYWRCASLELVYS